MQSSISTGRFISETDIFDKRAAQGEIPGASGNTDKMTHFRESVLETLLGKVPAMTSSGESPFVGFRGGDGPGRHLVRKHE